MGCNRYQRQIALQVGGDLPDAASRRLTAHLAACEACRAFAKGMEASRAALRRAAHDVREAEVTVFRERVLQAASRRDAHAAPAWRMRPARVAWVAVGAVVLAVGLGLWPDKSSEPVVRDTAAAPADPVVTTERHPKPQTPARAEHREAPVKLAQIQLATSDPDVVIILVSDDTGG